MPDFICLQVAEQAPQIAAQAGQQLIAGSQQVRRLYRSGSCPLTFCIKRNSSHRYLALLWQRLLL